MFRNNAYATLWEIDKANHTAVDIYEKYAEISISTSKKLPDGKYETDFSGKIRLIADAFEKVKGLNLSQGDRIQLLNVGVSNKYDKQRKVTYTNYSCFDFNVVEQKDKKPPKVTVEDSPIGDLDSDELPF